MIKNIALFTMKLQYLKYSDIKFHCYIDNLIQNNVTLYTTEKTSISECVDMYVFVKAK